MRIITFGTFDIFHVGHLRLLQRAKAMGSYLAVGLSTDELNFSKKSRWPIYNFDQRKEILLGLRAVDSVFPEESLDAKRSYVLDQRANILVMGDDWLGAFDDLRDVVEVRYLARTPSISTTTTIEEIRG